MGEFDIRLLDLTFLKGPNRWSYRPTMEALVDIGELEGWPSNHRPDVILALKNLLPGLRSHGCSYEVEGGFLRRLEEGTWPAHILEHITLELLEQAGHPVGFGRARSAGPTGHYYVVVRSSYEELTVACFEAARRMLVALYRRKPYSMDHELDRLMHVARRVSLPASTARLLHSAERARIPCRRFQGTDLLVVGHGPRQRRVWRGATDGTSAIAEGVARDKALMHSLLKEAGVPTPHLGTFREVSELLSEVDQDPRLYAIKAGRARTPASVTIGPRSAREVRSAAERALEFDSEVLLERLLPGEEFEILVIAGRVVSVAKATPIELAFDGARSVAQALGHEIEARLRGPFCVPTAALVERTLDRPQARQALEAADMSRESVPPSGSRLAMTLSAGIAGTPVESAVDASVARAATTAVRVVGLDVATVTIVAPHLGASLEETGGGIVGVDARPDLLSHLPRPGEKEDRVADALLECLVPVQEGARIPVAFVAGSNDGDEVAEVLSAFLQISGKRVGTARASGVWLCGRQIRPEPASFELMEDLVFSRAVDAVTMHLPISSLLAEGLPADRCFVSIVTGFDGEQPQAHLPDSDAYIRLMRTLVDVVLPDGAAVLNADDEGARALAEYCDGEVIYYGTHKSDAFLEEFAMTGGRSVGFRAGQLVLRSGNFRLERPMGNQVAPEVWLPAFAAGLKFQMTPELLVGALHSMESSSAAHGSKSRSGEGVSRAGV